MTNEGIIEQTADIEFREFYVETLSELMELASAYEREKMQGVDV